MNNESSQVGSWWILIRNLTYWQPHILVLPALEEMLRSSCLAVWSPPVGARNASDGGSGWTGVRRSHTGWGQHCCFSRTDEGAENVPERTMGKGDSVATPPPSRDYWVVWWIVFILSIVNRSCHFFFLLLFFPNGSFNTPIWEALVKCLKSQGRQPEHQPPSALSCRELSSVILSGLAGEGQHDPKGGPRTRRQVRFSQTVLWEGHVLGPQFLQL